MSAVIAEAAELSSTTGSADVFGTSGAFLPFFTWSPAAASTEVALTNSSAPATSHARPKYVRCMGYPFPPDEAARGPRRAITVLSDGLAVGRRQRKAQ